MYYTTGSGCERAKYLLTYLRTSRATRPPKKGNISLGHQCASPPGSRPPPSIGRPARSSGRHPRRDAHPPRLQPTQEPLRRPCNLPSNAAGESAGPRGQTAPHYASQERPGRTPRHLL